MSWQKIISTVGILGMSVASVPGEAFGMFANSPVAVETPTHSTEISLEFPPTDNRGAPRTGGGGTRSSGNSCVNKEGIPLTPLMPTRDNVSKTVKNNPTMYWFAPETTAKTGEFVLLDGKGNEVYYTRFNLPDKPSLVKLDLPNSLSLEKEQYYRWYFTLVCNESARSQDVYVEGFVQRIELPSEVQNTLQDASAMKQAEIYAANGVWNETLNIVEELRTVNPSAWQELLTSVELEKIDNPDEPITTFKLEPITRAAQP